MKYRCPYCGEPAFSTAEKMGIPVGHFGKYGVFFPTCPHCQQIARRAATQRSKGWSIAIFALYAVFCAALVYLFFVAKTYEGLAVALGAVGYVVNCFFLRHFDKSRSEVSEDPVFTVVVDAGRLPLRVGDIYVCRMLDRSHTNGIPQVIGLVDWVEKRDGKQHVTLRVIRCDDDTPPAADERVRIFTDGRYDVEGRVSNV